MDSLRLSLILIGVLVIAAVYLVTRWQYRKGGHGPRRQQASRMAEPEVLPAQSADDPESPQAVDEALAGVRADIDIQDEPLPRFNVSPEADEPTAANIEPGGHVLYPDANARQEPIWDEPVLEAPPVAAVASDVETLAAPIVEPAVEPVAQMEEPPASAPPREVEPAEEFIVALHILPVGDELFDGPTILRAAGEAGLEYGDMDIFHSYAPRGPRIPVFSLANMVQPGTFDPTGMDAFASPGLVLFMQLPGPRDPEGALQAMLRAARALAAGLDAVVCDARRAPLTGQTVAALERDVARYARPEPVAG